MIKEKKAKGEITCYINSFKIKESKKCMENLIIWQDSNMVIKSVQLFTIKKSKDGYAKTSFRQLAELKELN